MNRQTRTLLVLAAVGLGGAFLLMGIAQRYARIVNNPNPSSEGSPFPSRPIPGAAVESPTGDVQRAVDAFIAVRRRIQETIPKQKDVTLLARVRDAAIEEAELTRAQYFHVREFYLKWRRGKGSNAFERRREQIEGLDLGRFEEL